MNIRYPFNLFCLLSAVVLLLPAGDVAFAQKGKKGKGGGGGGSTAPVQYQILQVPYSKGRDVNANDLNIHGEVCGTVGVSPGPFEAVWYDGAGTTWTLNDLVDWLNPQARNGWNIEYAQSINDAGQITGGAKLGSQTAPFIVDPYDPANPFTILPPSPLIENGFGSAINNSGDVLIRATGIITVFYSSADQSYTLVSDDSQPEGMSDRDAEGNIIVAVSDGLGNSSRFVVNGGTVTSADWIPGVTATAINDFGTITGSIPGKGNSNVAMRYDIEIEIFKKGRKDLVGRGVDINNSGDVAIYYMMLFTPEHGVMQLEDLIQPSDRAYFTEGFWLISIDAITERDASGFPMILTTNAAGSSSEMMNESFVLVPIVSN